MAIAAEVIEAALSVGEAEGVPAPVLLAVALAETNGRAFAPVGGGREPLIRFEGHYFDRLLGGQARQTAREAGLAHPSAGRVRNPAGQAARWALLDRAAAIDREAACSSTSWGLCQVMGSHARRLGFADAQELVASARASAAGQLAIAARFLKEGGLAGLLARGDHHGFARRYNGPAYLRNGYHTKIAEAYGRAIAALGGEPLLRRGSRGDAVGALQRSLAAAGIAAVADGIFGPATEAAVRRFQAREGLAVDGIAGPRTLARLTPPD